MMERRVKERLVGATILVVLIVLIVPELLSGPKRPAVPPLAQGLPASTRSVTVDLSTNRATPSAEAASSAALSAGAASSAAASEGSAPPTPTPAATDTAGMAGNAPAAADAAQSGESTPTVTTLKAQDPSPPALESHVSPPKSASAPALGPVPAEGVQPHHVWAVQLGSFASKVNADKLAHQLQARGGPGVYIVSSGAGASARYRVRMGPLGDRGAAERAVAKLKSAGHAATVVTPAS